MLMSWRDPENTGGESWGEKVPSSGLTDDRRAAMLTVSCTAAAKKKDRIRRAASSSSRAAADPFSAQTPEQSPILPPFGRATPSHGAPMAELPPPGDGLPPVAIAAAGQWGFGAGRWSWLPSEPARRRSHTTRRPNNARNQGGSASAFPLQVRSFTEAVPFILLCPPPDPAHLHPSRPPRSAHNQTFVPPSPSWDYTLSTNTPVPSLVGDSILYPPRPSPLASPPT